MPLRQLRKHLPDRPVYQTVWLWCMVGRKHPDTKQFVRMEAIRGTRGLVSSVAAYWRFIERLNEV